MNLTTLLNELEQAITPQRGKPDNSYLDANNILKLVEAARVMQTQLEWAKQTSNDCRAQEYKMSASTCLARVQEICKGGET